MTVRSASALVVLAFMLVFGPLSLTAAPAQAAPSVYTLDPARSRLTIEVGKAGVFGFAGHEHQVVAGTFRGTATFDPERLAQSSVDLTFDAGALRVTGKGEPPEDVPQVQSTMVSPTCLDAGRFPTIRFVSSSVAAAGAAGPSGGDLRPARRAHAPWRHPSPHHPRPPRRHRPDAGGDGSDDAEADRLRDYAHLQGGRGEGEGRADALLAHQRPGAVTPRQAAVNRWRAGPPRPAGRRRGSPARRGDRRPRRPAAPRARGPPPDR